MPSSTKRGSDVIDLTGDSDTEIHRQPKVARRTQAVDHSQLRQHSTVVHHIEDDEHESEDELVDLSLTVDDRGVGFVQVGSIDGKIVGTQYYHGYASMGETVLVRREPQNQAGDIQPLLLESDRPYPSENRSQACAIYGTSLLKDSLDFIQLRLLTVRQDDGSLLVEGILAGEKGPFDCPIELGLFGTSEALPHQRLEERMKRDKLPLSKKRRGEARKIEIIPSGRKKLGFQSSQSFSGVSQPEEEETGPSVDQLVSSSERFSPRDIEELVEQWGATEEVLASMPMAVQPKNLKAQLLPYQLQGLAWMLAMEKPKPPTQGSKDIVQLWKRHPKRADCFTNIATNFSTQRLPPLASGGILADDMGLGKTVQVISVIVEGGPGTTLILAPVSVMSNWSQQIERHVNPTKALRVLTYHGSNRKMLTQGEFAKYNVVITSYGTLSSEYSSSKGHQPNAGIFAMQWRRVVLDEGHIIRNPSTKAAVAASSIKAMSRWVLTGTPIVNGIKDLYSMLKFLRITGGLEQSEVFNSILTRPLNAGDPKADVLLQAIMRSMCLRRKKEMKFVDLRLPPLSEYVHRIPFRNDEREKYKALQAEAEGMLHRLEQSQQNGKAGDTYRHLFELLLRLRQVCCHWKLCESRVTKLLELLDSNKVLELNHENRLALQAYLQVSIDNSDECPICLETLHNPVITACKHAFGLECIERTILDQHKCPMCRAGIKDPEQLVHPAKEGQLGEVEDEDIDVETKSSKTEALMSILKASRRDPTSKVVVFSQWTSFLNIIQHQLDEAGYKYTRIDGSMSALARDAAMRALECDGETRVLLASLAVCSVGLNLVAADTVILADSWWAPAIEDQAVDRVHRLGQTRSTTVWRLIMEDSIEERVLEIQKEKRLLVGKAFREKGKGSQTKTTRLADIQQLLR
ncbi:MAG: hypothetical protein M1818_000119 [Claussenomyces sp. TS43310]|nr:MAG: hypothetical protein M1818_000119 [Claussenomyces sp. TS43310]